MDFLHFGLLPYFLPLAAIPIILHLLTLHRLKTVELSTFRYLFDSYVQQRRRMKFLEWLIAALRTAFLLLLIFAISRPVVKHWSALFGGGGSGRDVVLLIDGSASMNAVTDGMTSLDRAKQAANTVVDRLRADDRVTVFRVGAKPEEICNRFSSDSEAIHSEIETLKATPSRANLFAAFSHLFGSEGRKLNSPTLYLFSDLQTSGWREFTDAAADSLIPPDTEMIVVNVGSNQEITNAAVVGESPEEQQAITGLPIKLRPRVVNHSETESQDIPVSIFVNEREIARKTISLKPGEAGEAEVIYTPTEDGVVRGRFEIPSDRFTADDQFMFTLNVAPQVRTILVNGNPAAVPLDNEGLYVRTAIIATEPNLDAEERTGKDETEADPVLAAERRFVRSLAVEDIPQANVNAEVLRDADVVILANCGALNAAQFVLLRDFVSGGGGLLVFPGQLVNPDVYNTQFFPSPEVPDEEFISAKLTAAVGDPNNVNTFKQFGAIDFAHPIFSVFAGSEQRYLTKVNVYQRFPVELPADRGNTWPLVEFEDGSPAVLESVYGNGRILISTFPLNTKWTNLPMKPEFVPLVLRMVSHVKRLSDVNGPSVVPADGTAEFVVSQQWAPASGKVTDIAGRITPVAFQRSNSRLVGAFERTIEQGYYTLEVKGGRAEQPHNGAISFAVNLAPGESDFSRLTGPQLKEMLPAVKVTTVDASAEAQQAYGNIGDEREIWRPLILLTFIIIGAEFLLSTLGGHLASDEDGPTTGQRIRDIAGGRLVGQMTGAGFRDEVENEVSQTN
ncbi:MAG: VWA domain-containing protein [Planctomycetota bacterium]|nr:VWA domain-containing protein [Planctomycetota bacterium]